MGENAKKEWEWHNNQVGIGYQAKGVVRQNNVHVKIDKVIDMRGGRGSNIDPKQPNISKDSSSTSHHSGQHYDTKDNYPINHEKKHKHSRRNDDDNIEKLHKHKKSKRNYDNTSKLKFDPLLQLFITKLKDAAQE